MKKLYEILLDEDDREPIILTDGKGKKIAFERIAIIPLDIGDDVRLFAVLKPIDNMAGVGDDEAVIFRAEEDGDDIKLVVEPDTEILERINDRYTALLDEALKSNPQARDESEKQDNNTEKQTKTKSKNKKEDC